MRIALSKTGMSSVSACAMVGGAAIVLSALAPAYVRTLRFSKLSEAPENLAAIYAASAAYFDRDHSVAGGTPQRGCLPGTAGPTPREPSVDAQDVRFDAAAELGAETWRALRFQPPGPVRYSYTYQSARSGCDLYTREGAELLRISAEGDLDGDGMRSLFQRRATSRGHSLYPIGVLRQEHPIE